METDLQEELRAILTKLENAIKDGTLSEVEPVGTMWVNLSSVVDFFPWKHKLPKDQK